MDAIDIGIKGFVECDSQNAEQNALTSVPRKESLPELVYPGGGQRVIDTADRLGEIMVARDEGWCIYGGALCQMGNGALSAKTPEEMVSVMESIANVVSLRFDKKTQAVEKTTAHLTAAENKNILVSAQLKSRLPVIHTFAPAPLLVEAGGKLELLKSGYNPGSGVFVTGGNVEDVSLAEALPLLKGMWANYHFNTVGDYARAIAATITPALVQGGFLERQAPLAVFQADKSQAGKGAAVRAIGGIYATTAKVITQRPSRGVGGMVEDLDTALCAGRTWICLDNVRGLISEPKIESLLTEDDYSARTLRRPAMDIKPAKLVMFATGNEMEMTVDLQNRSYCIDFRLPSEAASYRLWLGEVAKDIAKRQSRYLGAVHAVVRAWVEAGKPEMEGVVHPNMMWAGKLAWMTKTLFGMDLLDGYDFTGMAGKDKVMLRKVCLFLVGKFNGEKLRAIQIAELLIAEGLIETRRSNFDWESASSEEKGAYAKKVSGYFKPLPLGRSKVFSVEVEIVEERDFRTSKSYKLYTVTDSSNFQHTASTFPAQFPALPDSISSTSSTNGGLAIEKPQSENCTDICNMSRKVPEVLETEANCAGGRAGNALEIESPVLETGKSKPGCLVHHLAPKVEEFRPPEFADWERKHGGVAHSFLREVWDAEHYQNDRVLAEALVGVGIDAYAINSGAAIDKAWAIARGKESKAPVSPSTPLASQAVSTDTAEPAKPFFWKKEYDEFGQQLEEARRTGIPLKERDRYVNPFAKRQEEMLASLAPLLDWKR